MRSIEDVTQELALLASQHKLLSDESKEIYKKIVTLKKELIEIMNNEEVEQLRNAHGLFYFTHKKRANIIDYIAFEEFIYTNKRLDLINLKPSKEALEGEAIPGVELVPYRILNVRGSK